MDFAELRAELAARGFDYLGDDRLALYINRAYFELTDADLWPTRLTRSDPGPAPMELFVSGTNIIVLSVTDETTGSRLKPTDIHSLLSSGVDIDQTGTPIYYYTLKSALSTADEDVHTWPVTGGDITVWYYHGAVALPTDGSDPSLIPPQYHLLIVDIAVRMAYRDADNHEAAEALQVQIERDLLLMRRNLLIDNVDGPDGYIQTTERW